MKDEKEKKHKVRWISGKDMLKKITYLPSYHIKYKDML
jgi:hypothetical protein